MVKIIKIHKKSIAETIGLQPGDQLVAINGHAINDFIDYHFHQSEEKITLEIKRLGKSFYFKVEKPFDQDLGMELEPPKIRACGNNCIFCFVKQNPPGLRPSLYFPDEDYRFSFLHGTYITLTNIKQWELDRIVKYKLSPLYISVHATDDRVREYVFQLKRPDHLMDKLAFLDQHQIEMHIQIVLLPGINDEEILEKTLSDLYKFKNSILSVAIIPVGLTKHRNHLPKIEPVKVEDAKRILEKLRCWEKEYINRDGEYWVFLSDEFYLLAGEQLPSYKYYGSFYQIDNGVGMTRYFVTHFRRQKRFLPLKVRRKKRYLLITGKLAEPVLRAEVLPVLNNIENLEAELYAVSNNFFGETVTVSGLLVGKDIVEQVKVADKYDMVILPPNCVNSDGMLLDDMTPEDLAKHWGVPVKVFNWSFKKIVEA